MDRRKFLENSEKAVIASAVIPASIFGAEPSNNSGHGKTRVVLVGTGIRGSIT